MIFKSFVKRSLFWNNYVKIILCGLIWFLTVCFVLIAGKLSISTSSRLEEQFLSIGANGIASIVTSVFLYVLLTRDEKQKFSSLVVIRSSILWSLVLVGIIVLCFSALIFAMKITLDQLRSENYPAFLIASLNSPILPHKLAFSVACLILFLLIPSAEEFFYRFYFIESFRSNVPMWLAVVLSSSSYAILTAGLSGVQSAIFTSFFGLLLAWLYLKSKSLLPSLMLNIAITTLVYFFVIF